MTEQVSRETIRRMLRLVEPAWDLRDASPAERGFSPVYRVVVAASGSERDVFLKVEPDDSWGVAAEARIQAVLRANTAIPVPPVLGVVDEHDDLPTPFYVMDPMPGNDRSYEEVGWVSDDALETTVRQVGHHLGELHRLDAVDAYGHVRFDASRRLNGGRPAGTVDELRVADGFDSWTTYLRKRVEYELDRHESSSFEDLTPRLEPWCRERLAQLSGPFSPVLGRNDHGFHNLLLDPDTGDVTAMLDWAYTLAVPPAYDFEFAAYLFSGAFLAGIPEVPDRRDLVRDAMLVGYREAAPRLADAVATPRPLYEMLAMLRVMNDFERLRPKLPDGTASAAEAGLSADAASVVDGDA